MATVVLRTAHGNRDFMSNLRQGREGVIESLTTRIPAERDLIVLGMNPLAGSRRRGRRVGRFIHRLQELNLHVEAYTNLDSLIARVHQAHDNGQLRALVAAGGDGTAALLVNRTRPGIPLAVLPLGTENLLSKYLGVTSSTERLARNIARGLTVRLDAGSANGRIFLLMVGCGFDAEVVRRLHRSRRGHIHHLSYARPILQAIYRYEYPDLRISCANGDDVARHETTAKWAFVVNLPRYAGGLQIAPQASGADGLLDICTFKRGSLWNGLRYLGGIVLGEHRSLYDCYTGRSRKIHIESDEEVPYQLDGDPGGFLPVDIESLPGRLNLIVSAGWVRRHRFELMRAEPA